ncbi:serine/threonine-protein kinase [Schumannella sp. 10F1B-5-1]|uniref:serine/threonine-protein kinase n=1 Tax=Schumannella sp. 10F1B-5-1 TaxID=2590780 RepID=UPI0011306FE1|nr:serine/threonine-protein kinase [Schumannella sp. 10F1B-5-1]TPW76729.1 serine/threonine protein kinase [Schumannella sp. 10F1B-5-1]
MRPTSGLTFGGRYQLSSRIAIGGMGEVWQATDLVIGRTVALKILKDEYMGDPGFLERFRAEARHAALVNHEGIANVYDYGEEEGSAYLVMELVPGEALSAVLDRERVLSTDRVLDIAAQTASALHAAHMAGLVHRDIKPGNLLITPEGRVKITDFGIARIADQVPLTATGQVMGTVQYLSPEQASGHPASPATDVYSLGIVAYEALAGRRPFTGESQVAIAMAQINEAPPELPVTISEPVRNLVYACIAKKPADRPASAAHLSRAAQALRRGDVAGAIAAVPGVAGGDPVEMLGQANAGQTQATRVLTSAQPTPTSTIPVADDEKKKRHPLMWPLIAVVGVLLVAVIAIIIALVIRPTGDDSANSPSTSTSKSASKSASPSPSKSADDGVSVNPDDYVGKNVDEVSQALTDLGLEPSVTVSGDAPDPSSANTVTRVNPYGSLKKGDAVTITAYGDYPGPSAPPAPTSSSTTVAADAQFTVNWTAYSGCPAANPLERYVFSVSGATSTGGTDLSNVSGTSTSLQLKAASSGSITITYTAVCSGIAPTASSSPLNMTITAGSGGGTSPGGGVGGGGVGGGTAG